MTLYSVRDWNDLFENNRTRELKKLDWVPIPNKQDGDGYTELLSETDGPAIFGTWIALVQVASKCHPRGQLIRENYEPHTAISLSRMCRFPNGLIARSFAVLVRIRWLDSIPYEIPHLGAVLGAEKPSSESHPSEIALTGMKGMKEGNEGANGFAGGKVKITWTPTETQARLSAMFHRRQSTPWSDKEVKTFRKIGAIEPSDLVVLETYYAAAIPNDKDYRRRDLATLLNNFNGEVDRARHFKPESNRPKVL